MRALAASGKLISPTAVGHNQSLSKPGSDSMSSSRLKLSEEALKSKLASETPSSPTPASAASNGHPSSSSMSQQEVEQIPLCLDRPHTATTAPPMLNG